MEHKTQKEYLNLSFYKSIFENASDCILITNDKGQYIEVNSAACRCFGYTHEEFLKLSVSDILHESHISSANPESKSTDEPRTEKADVWSEFLDKGRQSGLVDCYKKNGTIISFEYNAVSNIQPGVHLSILREINMISRIWENIRQRDNRYENILKIFPDLLFLINDEGIFTDFFAGGLETLYKKPEDFMGKHITEVLPDPPLSIFLEKINAFKKTEKHIVFDYTLQVQNKLRVYEGNILRFRENEILFLARDITKLTLQNKELVDTREKLDVLLNNLHQSVTLIDEHYKIIAFNKVASDNARKIFKNEMKTGDSIINFVVERDKKDFYKHFEMALNGHDIYTERIFQDKQGNDIWFGFSYKKVPEKEMKHRAVILNVMDITRRKNAERVIIENENKYRSLFDNSPLGVGICNTRGKLLDINRTFLEILGSKDRQQTLQVNLLSFPPLKQIGFSKALKKCIKEKRYISKSKEYKSLWGKEVFVKFQLSPLKYKDGEVQTVQIVLEDYTDLHHAESALRQSEARYRNIFENAHLGIYQTTLDGKILNANNMQAQILGYQNAEEYINSVENVGSLYHNPEDREKFIELLLNKKSVNNLEYKAKRKDGQTIWISTTARLINLNNQQVIEGFNQDVTATKKQVEVAKALEIKEKSAEIKDQFLANMSHEIRTPVTGIMGMSEILQKTNLDPEQKKYLNIIQDSSSILLELINDILDLAKIEAGKMEVFPEKIEFKAFLEKLFALFDYRFQEKGIKLILEISADVPRYITTDPRRLKQILINLIGNALKFTHEGTVKIHAALKENRENSTVIKLSVEDTGQGIMPDQQHQIFEKFEQLSESYVRKSAGTGLGLPITKELVYLLGGEIGLDSEPGKGSTFWFTFLSVNDDDELPVKKELPDDKKGDNITYNARILVAEDKVTNQMVVNIMLTKMGCKVQIANNGKEALEMYEPGKFDLILMDIFMPELDGFTALKMLHEKYNPLCPVLALSANIMEGMSKKFTDAGFEDFLSKPYNYQQLSEKLYKWLPPDKIIET